MAYMHFLQSYSVYNTYAVLLYQYIYVRGLLIKSNLVQFVFFAVTNKSNQRKQTYIKYFLD